MKKENIFFAALFVLFLLAGIPLVNGFDEVMAEENGALENIQLLLLSIAFPLFLLRARNQPVGISYILGGCISFILLGLFREIDTRPLELPQWITIFSEGLGRDIILGCMGLSLIYFGIRFVLFYKKRIFRVADTAFAKSLLLMLVFLLIGDFFEQDIINIERAQLYEEFYETVGFAFLPLASFFVSSLKRLENS